MLSPGKWIICGAIALPIGFAIGYAFDARLPQANAKVVTSRAPAAEPRAIPVAVKPAEPIAAPVKDRPETKSPERAAPEPTPVAAPLPTPAPAPTAKPAEPAPAVKPAPVATPAPVAAPVATPKGLPGLKLPRGGIAIDDDEVKIRTPYGSFSFSL